ncbi:hypothetical protein ERJ75_000874700 [Trypanosoma vivax]|nr:hypothetical protein ERJ75_000874700 [Trypanosoma vivax]
MLPNKQQSRNGRLLPGRKCGQVPKQRGGDSNAGVLHLPPLVESTKMLMTSQLRHATRELRTQVMWQTGSPPGLRGQTENLGTGEMGDTLDALLDTHILHGEETLGSSYQVNTVKPPWYSVSLTLKQLQRHVCLSNMSLFGRLTSGEWSTASNCSSNVIAPVPKRDEKQKTKSKTVTHVQQIMTSVSEVRSESLTQPTEPNVGVSLSRRAIPHKNFVLALRQWQGGVQRELRGATANLDPVELHEKHMQIVLKEENAVRLVGHLENIRSYRNRSAAKKCVCGRKSQISLLKRGGALMSLRDGERFSQRGPGSRQG